MIIVKLLIDNYELRKFNYIIIHSFIKYSNKKKQ